MHLVLWDIDLITFLFARVQECEQYYDWDSAEADDPDSYNLTHYTHLCKIQGKR